MDTHLRLLQSEQLHILNLSESVFAQSFPTKSIRYVVPFPPGGITDMMARIVAQKTSDLWQQSVVVENKSGGNALIGADFVAKSIPDGHTWLAMTITHAINATLFQETTFNFEKDLSAVSILGSVPMVVVVSSSQKIYTLNDLTKLGLIRSLNGGSGGNGTPQHLALELYRQLTNINVQHIPFKGAMAPLFSLIKSDIDFVITALPEGLPNIKTGKLRGLSITSIERHPLVPNIPTTTEMGLAKLMLTSWTGLMVPSGTSKLNTESINKAVVAVVKKPEIEKQLSEQGFYIVGSTTELAKSFLNEEILRWRRVINDAKVTVD